MLLILFAAIGKYSNPRGQWASMEKGNRGGWEGGSGQQTCGHPDTTSPFYLTGFLAVEKITETPSFLIDCCEKYFYRFQL